MRMRLKAIRSRAWNRYDTQHIEALHMVASAWIIGNFRKQLGLERGHNRKL